MRRKRKTSSPNKGFSRKLSDNAGFSRRRQELDSIIKFNESSFGLMPGANFTESDDDELISKKALIIVEGQHKDNSGKKHSFTAEDIDWFAEETNKFLSEGGRVPWQQDHNKTQNSNIGDLESEVVTKIITHDDLPNPRLTNLVGKVGLFATELVGKGKDVVDKIRAGRIKTLSPGIDMATGIIREISATPTPAITGMSVFSRATKGSGMTATTWEEAENHIEMDDHLREQYDDLTETFWNIATNITGAGDDDIPNQNREKIFNAAIEGFVERVSSLLGLEEENDSYINNGDKDSRDSSLNGTGHKQKQAQHEKITLAAKLNNLSNFSRSGRRRRR